LSSAIFSGSHFPGSVSYAKAYNSEGTFAVPGLANYTTHGNSDTFGVTWAANVPDLPTLSTNFQIGSNQYSIFGTNDSGNNDFHSFGVRSGYRLEGFDLSAYYQDGSAHSLLPQVLQNSLPENVTSSNSGYGFALGHALPLHGAFSAGYNSSYVSSDYIGYKYSGNIQTYNATAAVQPTPKLHLSVTSDYSDNLTGVLYQSIISAGGLTQPPNQDQGSHSFDVLGDASYSILPNLQAQALAERRQQSFLGQRYGANAYGGGLTYGRGLFGGNLNAAVTVTDNTLDHSSLNTLGLNTTTNYSRRFDKWVVGGSFSYAQNVQTLLITYMASYYNYSGSVRRRFGLLSWSASATSSRTGLTHQPGTTNSSESYTSGLSYSHWVSVTGTYAKSDGNALQTGAGLIPTPIPPPILPSDLLILYAGRSYAFGLSSTPMRRLTVSASYSNANSSTDFSGVNSWNNSKQFNTLLQYQFRKMYLTGGYSQLQQGFSASGSPPANVSSFFIGVQRWFNFF
jgi:hypothetical protein